MDIAVLGATGRTGRHVVTGALARGHNVIALVRDVERARRVLGRHERLDVRAGDLLDGAGVSAALGGGGVDVVVFVAGPGPRDSRQVAAGGMVNVVRAMQRHGVRRLVCVSSSAVAPQRGGALTALVRRLRGATVGGATADDLRHMEVVVRQSELAWTIVRPSRLTDGPATGRYRVSLGYAVDGSSRIARADLAAFLLDQAETGAQSGHAVAIGS